MLKVRILPGLFKRGGKAHKPEDFQGGPVRKIIRFFQESFAELKKVNWPSREDVASNTKIVLVSVVLIAIALGIVDFLIFQAIELIF